MLVYNNIINHKKFQWYHTMFIFENMAVETISWPWSCDEMSEMLSTYYFNHWHLNIAQRPLASIYRTDICMCSSNWYFIVQVRLDGMYTQLMLILTWTFTPIWLSTTISTQAQNVLLNQQATPEKHTKKTCHCYTINKKF